MLQKQRRADHASYLRVLSGTASTGAHSCSDASSASTTKEIAITARDRCRDR